MLADQHQTTWLHLNISCSTFSLLAIAVSMAGVFHSCDSPPTFSNRSNFLPRFHIYPSNLWSVCLALVCPWKQNSENRQVLANGKDVISSGIFVSVTRCHLPLTLFPDQQQQQQLFLSRGRAHLGRQQFLWSSHSRGWAAVFNKPCRKVSWESNFTFILVRARENPVWPAS